MSLFLLAGEKMLKATTEWKELEQAYEAHEKNPCPNNTLKVEELEDKFEGTHEYETFGNETLQAAKLQSMDYCNKVTDKLYVYDLCRGGAEEEGEHQDGAGGHGGEVARVGGSGCRGGESSAVDSCFAPRGGGGLR